MTDKNMTDDFLLGEVDGNGFRLVTEEDRKKIEAWTAKLMDGYIPTAEELQSLDAMPELALQTRILLNRTLKDKYLKDPGKRENILFYTDSLYELGDYLIHFEYHDEALAMLDECIEIVEPLTETGNDDHLLTTLYVCHDRMGDIAVTSGDYEEAKRQYLIVNSIIRRIAEHNPEMEADQDYSIILDKLGYIGELSDSLLDAEGWYQKSLDIRLKQVKEGSIEARRRLIEAQKNLGTVKQKLASNAEARTLLQKAVMGSEMLYRESGETMDAEITVSALDKLGIIAKEEEKYPESRQYYEKAIKILEGLIAGSSEYMEDWQRSLSRSNEKLADAYQLEGDFASSEQYLVKAVEISEKLLRKTGSVEEIKDLMQAHDRIGDICGVTGRTDQALKEYGKAVKMHKKIKGPKDETIQSNLFFILKKVSIINRGLGNTADAGKWGETALRVIQKIVKDNDSEENLRYLADCYTDLGELAEDTESWSVAQGWYEKALKVNERLYEENPTIDNKSEYSDTHDGLGYVAAALNDTEKAEKHYRICLTLNEELLHDTGLVDEKRALAVTCRQLGLIAVSHKDLPEARRYLERSMELQKDVMHETNDQEDRLTYGDIYEDVMNLPCERITLPSRAPQTDK